MYELGLDHVFANPPWSRNLPEEDIHLFAQLFADEETFIDLEMSLLHRIVLGLVGTSLEDHLRLGLDNINAQDAGGRTPLMWATRRGDVSAIKLLLAHGADPNVKDRSLVSPLHKAVADADDESVMVLLQAGAVANVFDDYNATPLHNLTFCPRYRPKTIVSLLRHGADIEARDEIGRTPLSWLNGFKRRSNCENAAMLVACGAKVDCLDDMGDSPLNDAVVWNDVEMLKTFVMLGGRFDIVARCGCSVITLAARCGSIDIWRVLTEAAEVGEIPASLLGQTGSCKHMRHDIWTCLETCRNDAYLGERESKDVELEEFRKLIAAVEKNDGQGL